MKRKLLKFSILLAATLAFMISSCSKDDDTGEENEEEVITTLQLTFVPVGGGATATYKFDDPDGPGGTNPIQDDVVLVANSTYNVTVQLLNKTKSPAEDITTEVAAESQAHRFYYQASAASNIVVSGLNNDVAGTPLGITSTWTTGTSATGTIKVTLRHYPGNPPNKAATDDVNSSKSATDLEVDFKTTVQ